VIPSEINDFVSGLLEIVDCGAQSLWLYGSRANNRSRSDSDWDLILFADVESFEKLKRIPSLANEGEGMGKA
jgi:predicted nucleotidyltransferase